MFHILSMNSPDPSCPDAIRHISRARVHHEVISHLFNVQSRVITLFVSDLYYNTFTGPAPLLSPSTKGAHVLDRSLDRHNGESKRVQNLKLVQQCCQCQVQMAVSHYSVRIWCRQTFANSRLTTIQTNFQPLLGLEWSRIF